MRGRTGRGDSGQSLVELLISVAILGIAFVAILQGIGTTAFTSDFHRKQVDAHDALVSAAEAVKDVAHVACATKSTASYVNAVNAAPRPSGWATTTVTISSVKYWNGSTFGATCYDTDALGHLLTVQLVTVNVASPDGRVTDVLRVTKRAAA